MCDFFFLREVGTFVQLSNTGVAAPIHSECAGVSNSTLKSLERFSSNKWFIFPY